MLTIVKYLYVLESLFCWFDALAPALAINFDDRRAVPGIVRFTGSGEGEPKHSAGNVDVFRGDLRGEVCFRGFVDLLRRDH